MKEFKASYDELLAENLALHQKLDELMHRNSELMELHTNLYTEFVKISARLQQYEKEGRLFDRVKKV